MGSGNYEYQSDFARKYFAQGLAGGAARGHAGGATRQEGEAMAVLEVLDARGVPVNAMARRRILACTDLTQLKKWLRRAATVTSLKELFADRPASPRTARQTRAGASSPARGN